LRARDDDDLRLRGTFVPDRRASDRPIATACFLLVTRFAERPDRNFPSFISCMARPTLVRAFVPYLRRPVDFLVAISFSFSLAARGQRGRVALRVACQLSEHTWHSRRVQPTRHMDHRLHSARPNVEDQQ